MRANQIFPKLLILATGLFFIGAKGIDEFEKMNTIIQQKKFYYELNCILYQDSKKTIIADEQRFKYAIWDNYSHLTSDKFELFQDKNYCIAIIDFDKEIFVDRATAKTKRLWLNPFKDYGFLDSLKKVEHSIELIHEDSILRTFSITNTKNQDLIEKILFQYFYKSGKPKKIEIYYSCSYQEVYGTYNANKHKSEKSILVLDFLKFEKLNEFPKSEFDYSNFIAFLDKGKYKRGIGAKGYTITTNLK